MLSTKRKVGCTKIQAKAFAKFRLLERLCLVCKEGKMHENLGCSHFADFAVSKEKICIETFVLPLQRSLMIASVPSLQTSGCGCTNRSGSSSSVWSDLAWASDLSSLVSFGLFLMSRVFSLLREDRDSGSSFRLLWLRFRLVSFVSLPSASGSFFSLLWCKYRTWKIELS